MRLRKIRNGWNWKRVGRCRAICCRTVFPSSMKAFFLLFYPTLTVSHAISNLLQIIVNDLCFLLSSICPPQPTVTGWNSCLNSSTQHNKTIWKPMYYANFCKSPIQEKQCPKKVLEFLKNYTSNITFICFPIRIPLLIALCNLPFLRSYR